MKKSFLASVLLTAGMALVMASGTALASDEGERANGGNVGRDRDRDNYHREAERYYDSEVRIYRGVRVPHEGHYQADEILRDKR